MTERLHFHFHFQIFVKTDSGSKYVTTTTHPSWVALHAMAHSFIELDKAVVHVIRLVSFL